MSSDTVTLVVCLGILAASLVALWIASVRLDKAEAIAAGDLANQLQVIRHQQLSCDELMHELTRVQPLMPITEEAEK